jgi:hypothetical protein
MVGNFLLLVASTVSLWRFYSGRKQSTPALAVALFFVPSLFCLRMGQMGILILAGCAGFLYLERTRKWFAAGAALALIAVKPQLLYLVCLALLLWSIQTRRWRVLAGLASCLAALTLVALAIDPHVIGQYLAFTRGPFPQAYLSNAFGSPLRRLFGREHYWLQFLPSVFGAAWFARYWLRNRRTWSWASAMPELLLASVLTTSYGWIFDQVVLLVPVLASAAWMFNDRGNDRRGQWVVLYTAANFAVIALFQVTMAQAFTPLAWIALYAWSKRVTRARTGFGVAKVTAIQQKSRAAVANAS